MLEALNIKEVKSLPNPESYFFLHNILKEENPDSILASLSEDLLNKYFQILIRSKNIFLYFCEYNKVTIGYAILSKKPSSEPRFLVPFVQKDVKVRPQPKRHC